MNLISLFPTKLLLILITYNLVHNNYLHKTSLKKCIIALAQIINYYNTTGPIKLKLFKIKTQNQYGNNFGKISSIQCEAKTKICAVGLLQQYFFLSDPFVPVSDDKNAKIKN